MLSNISRTAGRTAFCAAVLALAGAASAAEIELISRVSHAPGSARPGATAAEARGAFSADGRFYVYASQATSLVPGVLDLNGGMDVFLADRSAGTTRLLSAAHGAPRRAGDRASSAPLLSADGRFVLFTSDAGDLLATPTLGRQIYLYEVATGHLRLVSHRAGQPGVAVSGNGDGGAISADGRFVAFGTAADASELMPAIVDVNGFEDLFVWDSELDRFELATRKAGAPEETPGSPPARQGMAVTEAGELALLGPQQLAAPQPGGALQVFLFDAATAANTLASRSSLSPTVPGNAPVRQLCDFSADGRYLLFTGAGTDHVAGQVDTNGADDLFLFDRDAGTVELISAAAGAPQRAGDLASGCGSLSPDGSQVIFASRAGDLAASADLNTDWDLFRRDRPSASTIFLTTRADAPDIPTGQLRLGRLPAGGGVQLFASIATQMVAGASLSGGGPWSFRWDQGSRQVALALHLFGDASAAAPSEPWAISGNGAAALYAAADPAAFTGVPASSLGSGQLLLSVPPAVPSLASPAAFAGRGSASTATGPYSRTPEYPSAQAADDGSQVAFLADSNEICGSDRPLCLLDRRTGTMRNARHRWDDPNAPVPGQIHPLAISQDGRKLLLQSKSPFHAPTDSNGNWDLFLYDTEARSYELISHRHEEPTVAANRLTDQYRRGFADLMTPDARRIVFVSQSLDIVPGLGVAAKSHVYFTDRLDGHRRLVSHRDGDALAPADGHSFNPHISADGRYIVLASYASNLLAGFVDGNGGSHDLYLYDVSNDLVQLVSRQAGNPRHGAGLGSDTFLVSVTGRYVVHSNRHPDMVAGATDTNDAFDLFRYDANTGSNELITHVAGNPLVASSGSCAMAAMSTDGRFVLLRCTASDLVPGVGSDPQLYLWDGADSSLRLASHRQGAPGQPIDFQLGMARMSPDGSRVFYATQAADVIPGLADGPDSWDLFVWERETGKVELITRHFGRAGHTAEAETCNFDYGYAPPSANGERILFYCSSPALAPYDNNGGSDLFLAFLPRPLFADGFETGTTLRWAAVLP